MNSLRSIRRGDKDTKVTKVSYMQLLIYREMLSEFMSDKGMTTLSVFKPRGYHDLSPIAQVSYKWDKIPTDGTLPGDCPIISQREELPQYSVGISSNVSYFNNRHILLIDCDIKTGNDLLPIIEKTGPVAIFISGRGYHLICLSYVYTKIDWEIHLDGISKIPGVCIDFVRISKLRGYSVLRISPGAEKPIKPIYLGKFNSDKYQKDIKETKKINALRNTRIESIENIYTDRPFSIKYSVTLNQNGIKHTLRFNENGADNFTKNKWNIEYISQVFERMGEGKVNNDEKSTKNVEVRKDDGLPF